MFNLEIDDLMIESFEKWLLTEEEENFGSIAPVQCLKPKQNPKQLFAVQTRDKDVIVRLCNFTNKTPKIIRVGDKTAHVVLCEMNKSGRIVQLKNGLGDNPKAVLAEKVFGGKLRIIFTGGAHLDPYYIDRFAEYGVQILEGYGMSECSPVISNNTPENHKPGSIGRPLENVEIRFENGEILVKGTSVMKGYYQMPDETAETLKDGWLHTGDKGYMDEDGYLFINGRVKNLIILSNGENVSPEEIENKLALNPLVGEVIVTGEDNGLTARIYPEQAVVEAKALDTEMIRSQLQEFLDEYNKNQPTYRRITGLVIRKNPFIRSTTKKIRRQDVLIDEPQA